MPRYWPVVIELWNGEEIYRVEGRPVGFRGKKWLSWIPYQTGAEFVVNVKVSSLKTTGTRDLYIFSTLTEPNEAEYTVIEEQSIKPPFETKTALRYLARTGEYVLGVSLYSLNQAKPPGERFNRRVLTLESQSQDRAVGTILLALITSVVVFVVGTIITSS